MMKATAWFCPVLLTLLCATRLVCTAQRGGGAQAAQSGGEQPDGNSHINGYPLDYLDARNIQDDFLLAKRNKPSLSIVNPLDVLRQRLLLEIARRQMKENTRQVELNRAILKNVGKRVYLKPAAAGAMISRPYSQQLTLAGRELARAESQSNKRKQQLHWTNFPSPLQWNYAMPQSPDTTPSQSQSQSQKTRAQKLFNYAKKSLSGAGAGAGAGQGLAMSVVGRHEANGNEVANEKYHENHGNGNAALASKNATIYVADTDVDDNADDDNEYDNAEEESRMEDKTNLEPNGIAAGVDNTIEYLPWNFLYRYLPQKKRYNDI
ncbi:uncharacterized protein LOC117898062 [Drosophila subobscura]|uniref:uncharacterized protein LOC117898062 n=1 Tax=Drosophila subobscura TaxID=7241 RepID=UPI00155B0C55|nr:uncharacterized protein LOC117898062 [Drosophila subobscura]XP_034663121.1 uncharacterized protein LOC117898062 [Drosophila subobscura]